MRWRTQEIHGNVKVTKRFAWLPVSLHDGTTVWLERYVTVEQYYKYQTMSGGEWTLKDSYSLSRMHKLIKADQNEEISKNPSLWG